MSRTTKTIKVNLMYRISARKEDWKGFLYMVCTMPPQRTKRGVVQENLFVSFISIHLCSSQFCGGEGYFFQPSVTFDHFLHLI